MPEVLVTAATDSPVTLDEVKLHLRVTHNAEDTEIQSAIDDAVRFLEDRLGQQFITATWRYVLPCFPNGCIRIPRPPLQSVTSITYVDSAGTTQTLASSEYQVVTSSLPGIVAPARTKFWPTTDTETIECVKINYEAGYGDDPDDVPPAIKRAIKFVVGHWYVTREPISPSPGGKVELTLDSVLATVWHGEYAGARK